MPKPFKYLLDFAALALLRCGLMTIALSLSIELLQPLINGARSVDITDVITKTTGGLIGYVVYALFAPRKPKTVK